jgi:hypothetical protein
MVRYTQLGWPCTPVGQRGSGCQCVVSLCVVCGAVWSVLWCVVPDSVSMGVWMAVWMAVWMGGAWVWVPRPRCVTVHLVTGRGPGIEPQIG